VHVTARIREFVVDTFLLGDDNGFDDDSLTSPRPVAGPLRLAGFVRREQGADEPIRFMAQAEDDDGDVNSLVSDPDAWFVTSADSDLEYAMTPATASDPPSEAPGSSPATAIHVR
jgi:hypothetical protein